MIMALTSQGGMGERGMSSPIAAPIDFPFKPFDSCKQSSLYRFPFPSFSKPYSSRVGSWALIQPPNKEIMPCVL